MSCSLPLPAISQCGRSVLRVAFYSLLSLSIWSPPSAAGEEADAIRCDSLTSGSVLIRGRIIASIPVNQFSRVEPVGGHIFTPTKILPDLDMTYFLSDRIALAGQAGVVSTKTSLRGSLIGTLPIGSTWSFAATGAIQFHLLPSEAFNPYVGLGAGYTSPLAYEPAKPIINKMKANMQLGPMLQIGFDYHLIDNWYFNLEIKRLFLPTQSVRIGSGSATVKVDMLMLGAGIGYRF